jgi:ligand-binding sensor domain-containing protein
MGEPKTIAYGQPKTNVPGYDPYFIAPDDTITPYGPRSITRNMLQDKKGNIWFATWEGIIRYDGKSFANFTLTERLRRFHVFCVLEDKTGSLWFGTIGAGAYRYDGKSFTNFTEQEGLANNRVGCMSEDAIGNIWFGTDSGASRYNGKSFTNFKTKDGLSDNYVHSIMLDKTGKIWFGTDNGVCSYDPGKNAPGEKPFTDFTNKEGLPFKNVRAVIEDRAGNIWIGSEDGLFRYDGKTITNFTTNFIGYIFEDKTGNLWLSEGEVNSRDKFWNPQNGMALYRYDGSFFIKITERNSADDSQIFGIFEDKAGYIWFSTMQGVCRYDGKHFTAFTE